MTNLEFVSRVISGLNSLSKDDRISKRHILSVGRGKSEFLISQKMADRSLYREDNIFKTIDCFKLERINVTKCDIIEFRNCKNIMKSVKKLPKLIYSKYGNSLKDVTTIDNEIDFKFTTPSQHRRDKNRQGTQDYISYYVKDGYLYLLDTEVEVVNLYMITLETDKIDKISDCSDKICKSLWDYEFVYPSKLEEPIIQETIKEIVGKKGIPADTNPNLDNNQKGKTIQ